VSAGRARASRRSGIGGDEVVGSARPPRPAAAAGRRGRGAEQMGLRVGDDVAHDKFGEGP